MFKKIASTILTIVIIAIPAFALAQTTSTQETANLSDAFGEPLQSIGQASGYRTQGTSFEQKVGNAINFVFGILGVLFVIFIIYSGYLWMTAGGNEDKVKKAKDNLYRSTIGLIIILGAYAISIFVLKILIN